MAAKFGGGSPDQLLLDAARNYGRRVAGQGVSRVTLTLADGSKRKLDVPPAGEADARRTQALADFPEGEVPAGWHTDGRLSYFGGTPVVAPGKAGALLAALADAGPGGLSVGELKRVVWKDDRTEDRTVQNTVSRLRTLLLGVLADELGADPVPAVEGGYALAGWEAA